MKKLTKIKDKILSQDRLLSDDIKKIGPSWKTVFAKSDLNYIFNDIDAFILGYFKTTKITPNAIFSALIPSIAGYSGKNARVKTIGSFLWFYVDVYFKEKKRGFVSVSVQKQNRGNVVTVQEMDLSPKGKGLAVSVLFNLFQLFGRLGFSKMQTSANVVFNTWASLGMVCRDDYFVNYNTQQIGIVKGYLEESGVPAVEIQQMLQAADTVYMAIDGRAIWKEVVHRMKDFFPAEAELQPGSISAATAATGLKYWTLKLLADKYYDGLHKIEYASEIDDDSEEEKKNPVVFPDDGRLKNTNQVDLNYVYSGLTGVNYITNNGEVSKMVFWKKPKRFSYGRNKL